MHIKESVASLQPRRNPHAKDVSAKSDISSSWHKGSGTNALFVGELVRVRLDKVDFEASVDRIDEEGADN